MKIEASEVLLRLNGVLQYCVACCNSSNKKYQGTAICEHQSAGARLEHITAGLATAGSVFSHEQ